LSDRHHVLHFESSVEPFRPTDETNPYLAFRRYLAVDSLGESLGLSDDQRVAIITSANEAVSRVAGTGFLRTPLTRSDELSEALGFSATGGIWVKDETANVGGSHKARHIFSELLHLLMVETAGQAPWTPTTRPLLAIASCGNAAIAASTNGNKVVKRRLAALALGNVVTTLVVEDRNPVLTPRNRTFAIESMSHTGNPHLLGQGFGNLLLLIRFAG
jgi:hypothetical protein